ncbi:MAG: MFS transporter [Proteobacteria bacterium]|nr:MFS transporter [Pseudomonadota bacterium]
MSDPPIQRGPRAASAQILATVVFTFIAYLVVGLPLAALPPFVHGTLHFSSVLAGLSVSVQYLATFVTRAPVGRMTDTVGPKIMVILGLGSCAMSGLFTAAGGLLSAHPALSLTLLLIGRLFLGAGESGVGTGAIGWAIGRVGPIHSARIISWNGVATFAGIAIGAPLGVTIEGLTAFWVIGLVMLAGGLLVLPFAASGPVTHLVRGPQIPMGRVFGRVLPHGAALALGSLGFGTIASFVTLFFASRHWGHAAVALSAFGGFFILSRLLFVSSIARQGGLRVACVSFAGEAAGLVVMGLAASPLMAVAGAALTGFGFALVFPALGVEAFQRVPSTSRGAALGVFSVFLDVALGVTGPLAGVLVGIYGYSSIFLIAAVAAVVGGGITVALGARLVRPAS